MRPEEIEEMLYHRAVRSKIRPALPKRLSNFALHRAVASTAMASTALLATLTLTGGDTRSSRSDSNVPQPQHPQMTDTKQNVGPSYSDPDEDNDPITTSLAMTR